MFLSLSLGRTRVEKRLTSSRMNFPFLSVSIQNQIFMMNYKHIYMVNDTAAITLFKNNLQSRSCKLHFPNSLLQDDLIDISYISIFYHYSKDFKHTQVFQRRPEILLKSKENHEWVLFYFLYKRVKRIFAKPRKIK